MGCEAVGVGEQGPLVCKAEPLAATVNKLKERRTAEQKEDRRRTRSNVETERGKKQRWPIQGDEASPLRDPWVP